MTNTAKLTPKMIEALKFTAPGDLMAAGPTRAALIRRALVYRMDATMGGKLTPAGIAARANLLEAEARNTYTPDLAAQRTAEASLAAAILEDDTSARKVIGAGSDPVILPGPERLVQVGDTVRIHTGTRLYRVEKLDVELIRDNVAGTAERNWMAKLAPWDPADTRDFVWEPADLLHVVPPVAHLKTLPVGGSGVETLAEEPVVVAGAGWDISRGSVRQVATVRPFSQRLPHAVLLPWPTLPVEWAAGCMRIGDSIVVDGRCFRAHWDGGPAEVVLVPENWHGFNQL